MAEDPAKKETEFLKLIGSYKQKAIDAKKANNISEAKNYLKQSKNYESEL